MKKNRSKTVSVLIPTYNRAALTIAAIESVLAQSYSDYEIIVADNCSDDGSAEQLADYVKDKGAVQLIRNGENLGPVGNWRVCLAAARGRYIKWLWSDDLLAPDCLEKLVAALENNPDAAFAFSRVNIFSEKKAADRYRIGSTGRYSRERFYRGVFANRLSLPVSPGCALLRRQDTVIAEQIPNRINARHLQTGAGVDLWMLLQPLANYSCFYYTNEPLSLFRDHRQSLTVSNKLFREYYTAKLAWLHRQQLLHFRSRLLGEIFWMELLQGHRWLSARRLRELYDREEPKAKISRWRGALSLVHKLLHW